MQSVPKVAIRTWTHKRGLNTKLHLVVDAQGIPIGGLITSGATADCAKAESLIASLDAQYLLADNGFDSEASVNQARARKGHRHSAAKEPQDPARI
jgi:IS5 family transposase